MSLITKQLAHVRYVCDLLLQVFGHRVNEIGRKISQLKENLMKLRFFLGLAIVALLAAIILALVLFVFRPQPEPTVIRFSSWADSEESLELQGIIDSLNQSQNDYQIVHLPIPVDYNLAAQAQILAGDGGDLYWLDQPNMGLVEQGLFMPLNECLANAAPQTVGDLGDYYSGILSYVRFGQETYGLPFIANPVVTYYNKDLFDNAGLAYPDNNWTWNDLLSNAQALTKDTDGNDSLDQWGFIADGWPPPHIFIWQAGGELISDDLSQSPIDSPEAIAGFEFYKQLAFNPALSPNQDTISEVGFEELFRSGRIAMYMGNADESLDSIEGLDVGLVRVPANPQTGLHTTYAWSAAMVINATTANPQEACHALLALTDALQQREIVSPRISHASVERIAAIQPLKAASAEAIIEAAADMRVLPSFGSYQDWNNELWGEYLRPWINGDISGTKIAEALGNPDTLILSLGDFARAARLNLEALLPQSSQ
jgi:multiple sugar transport system substrate-binding protein